MSEDAEVTKLVGALGPDDKRKVLDFMRKLVHGRPRGTPGAELREFAGCISHEDAQKMLEAMEECRQIEPETWDPRYVTMCSTTTDVSPSFRSGVLRR